MSVEYVEVLVEEPSLEAALRLLLPRILGPISFEVFPFQCKDDLLARLPQRMKGYSNRMRSDPWFREHARVVVVVDRDDNRCEELRQRLDRIATDAGLAVRSAGAQSGWTVVNRLAIEELEAWYFGDWEAVRAAYPRVPATLPSRAGFRDPDAIAGGTWETFERVLQGAGYFRTGLRKIEAARSIAARMEPTRNRSRSFRKLHEVLAEMVQK